MAQGVLNQRVVRCPRCASHKNQVRLEDGPFDANPTTTDVAMQTWRCDDKCRCIYAVCTQCSNSVSDGSHCAYCQAMRAEAVRAEEAKRVGPMNEYNARMHRFFDPLTERFQAGDPVTVDLANEHFAVAKWVDSHGVEVYPRYGGAQVISDMNTINAIMHESLDAVPSEIAARMTGVPDPTGNLAEHPSASVQPAAAPADTTGATGSDMESGDLSAPVTGSPLRLFQRGDQIEVVTGERAGDDGQIWWGQPKPYSGVIVRFNRDGGQAQYADPQAVLKLISGRNDGATQAEAEADGPGLFQAADVVKVIHPESPHFGQEGYVMRDAEPGKPVRVMIDATGQTHELDAAQLAFADDIAPAAGSPPATGGEPGTGGAVTEIAGKNAPTKDKDGVITGPVKTSMTMTDPVMVDQPALAAGRGTDAPLGAKTDQAGMTPTAKPKAKKGVAASADLEGDL